MLQLKGIQKHVLKVARHTKQLKHFGDTWSEKKIDTAAQVTTDPATLAPTNKLDPRAIAWLQSLGVTQKETLQVF